MELIEQDVPSRELCREMKELGFPQEGMFYWVWRKGYNSRTAVVITKEQVDARYNNKYWNVVLAPTTGQLIKRCPGELIINSTLCDFVLYKTGCVYLPDGHNTELIGFPGNPNICLPNMLIHLAKEKLINPKEVGR